MIQTKHWPLAGGWFRGALTEHVDEASPLLVDMMGSRWRRPLLALGTRRVDWELLEEQRREHRPTVPLNVELWRYEAVALWGGHVAGYVVDVTLFLRADNGNDLPFHRAASYADWGTARMAFDVIRNRVPAQLR